jgi:hypothetical protein
MNAKLSTVDEILSYSKQLTGDQRWAVMNTVMNPRRIRWMGHVAGTGVVRNTCKILIEDPEKEILLGRL